MTKEAYDIVHRHPDWYFLKETETHVDMSEWPGGGYHFIKKPVADKELENADV